MKAKLDCRLLALSLVLAAGMDASHAQSYPTKPIYLRTGGAGGGLDTVARLYAPELSANLGQPIVVENNANLLLATGVAKAPPDGYTLMLAGGSTWIAPLFDKVSYDPVRDFTPVATITRTPNLLVVTPMLPVKTVADLVKLAKSKPGELNISAGSNGSSGHIGGELLKSLAGVDVVRVNYKDSQEDADLMSGRVHFTFGAAAFLPLVRSGKLRAIATGGTRRSLLFPDLPTVAETVPGFTSEVINGLLVPTKTPDAIVARLNRESIRVLEKPDVRERFMKIGVEPGGGTPEQFAEIIKLDIARVDKIVKGIGTKPGGA